MEPDESDEQIYSWIDSGSPELDLYLERRPGAKERVERLRARVALVAANVAAARLPEWIGPYRVTSLLGMGGMGIVYEAEQKAPRRRVAVKLLPPGAADDDRRVRLFRREAEAQGRLSHPSIAAIHEAGRTEDGRDYFVMELVRGAPLDRHVREAALDRGARLALFLRIAEAVQHAHDRGVVHRDLKPSNILVDGAGCPKILDFGLARILDPAASSASFTASGDGLLGTLPYMSPEQVRGGAAAADARSDVYAMGVLLHELLTGSRPVDIEGCGVPEAARRICETPPRPPSAFAPDCRGNLDAIVLRAVAKDPGERYASAAAMIEALRAHLAGGIVTPRRRAARRGPLLLAAAGALVIAAVGAVAVTSGWFGNGATHARFELPPASDDKFPRAAPYAALRFAGEGVEVQVDSSWFELVSIDGAETRDILAYCRATFGDRARKRFAQDLVEVLYRLEGRMPRFDVDLELKHLETGEVTVRRGVPMTAENRDLIWQSHVGEE